MALPEALPTASIKEAHCCMQGGIGKSMGENEGIGKKKEGSEKARVAERVPVPVPLYNT
jgi:hypothetical protein